jgi:hypothetical protein
MEGTMSTITRLYKQWRRAEDVLKAMRRKGRNPEDIKRQDSRAAQAWADWRRARDMEVNMQIILANANGTFWTGEAWGARKDAEVYASPDDLPCHIQGVDGDDLELDIRDGSPLHFQATYSEADADKAEARTKLL